MGEPIEANYKGEGRWYPGTVGAVTAGGLVHVNYDDGDKEASVELERVRRRPIASGASASGGSPAIASAVVNSPKPQVWRWATDADVSEARLRLGDVAVKVCFRRDPEERAEGTLSTYTLMLQLFFHLQKREPPVLPLFTCAGGAS